MTHDLDDLIDQLAAHLAHSRDLSPATAERMVRRLLDQAWTEYRDAGAPLDDADAGLARCIVERPRRPPTV